VPSFLHCGQYCRRATHYTVEVGTEGFLRFRVFERLGIANSVNDTAKVVFDSGIEQLGPDASFA
jgi:hypothetical protein